MQTRRAFLATFALIGGLYGICGCLHEGDHPSPAPVASASTAPASSVPADPFAADEDRARAPVEVVAQVTPHPVLIQHATVLTATGHRYAPGYVLMEEGLVTAVGDGDGPTPKDGTAVVDARGKFVTPGIIDPHSHMGVYPEPGTTGHDDGNELTDPITAGLRAEHSFWPQDPGARAGGRGRRDDHRRAAGQRQSHRRSRRRAAPDAAAGRARHALPRRAGDPQDGVRREPQARLPRR